MEEDWSIELHTKASPTNAYGTVDFQDTATRVCRAKVTEQYLCCLAKEKMVVCAIIWPNFDNSTPIFYTGAPPWN